MKNLTPELIAKAKAAKSAEELLELAKANGIELTADEAKTYFEQLNANGAVSDSELDAVAGGGCIIDDIAKVWKHRKEIAENIGSLAEASVVQGKQEVKK